MNTDSFNQIHQTLKKKKKRKTAVGHAEVILDYSVESKFSFLIEFKVL